ncbi:MAG: phage major capsid protein [Clostridiales bacterium]|nr:phage major capsid protein [Clostridiales bacterium]
MTDEQLEERKSSNVAELDNEGADLDALEAEVRSIKEELETRAKEEAQKVEIRKTVADIKAPVVMEKVVEEKREMKTNEEIRASKEYIDAYARYMISENDAEVRSLLTETVSGTVPVPTIVDDIIRTAWEKSDILSRVRKTNIRGNLKVPFELSADGAYEHTEGTAAPTEESLTLGIVTMIPKNIKKWIRISDEAIAMGGETLVRYIYDEITYQIIKKLTALVIADITTASTSASSSAVDVPAISMNPALTTVATAFANLSDEATDPVIIMNKITYASFIGAQAGGNFSFDPFNGLPVLFSSALPAYSSASTNQVYAIVGDLKGAQVNYPEGEGIVLKYDDLSEAEADLVKIVGRQYAAHALTARKMFCNIKKTA